VQRVDVSALARLPRVRPKCPPSPSRHAKKAIDDLRRARPPIELKPGMEATFLEGAELTQAKCLHWLEVLKQFFAEQPPSLSEPVVLSALPPISFLNLLIDWIDGYARTGSRRKKGVGWRWDALRGFVKQRRPLQRRVDRHGRLRRRGLLDDVSIFAKSISRHFSRPPFDDRLLSLWGDYWHSQYLQHSRPESPSCNEMETIERGQKAAKVFDTLRRFAKDSKVVSGDYSTLALYVSKGFHEPFFIKELYDQRERQEHAQLKAHAAASDVYAHWLKLRNQINSHEDYVRNITTWFVELGEPRFPGEPNIRPEFDAIHWRFCARPTVNSRQRPKKSVLRSKAT
jgi:hypothetical protein